MKERDEPLSSTIAYYLGRFIKLAFKYTFVLAFKLIKKFSIYVYSKAKKQYYDNKSSGLIYIEIDEIDSGETEYTYIESEPIIKRNYNKDLHVDEEFATMNKYAKDKLRDIEDVQRDIQMSQVKQDAKSEILQKSIELLAVQMKHNQELTMKHIDHKMLEAMYHTDQKFHAFEKWLQKMENDMSINKLEAVHLIETMGYKMSELVQMNKKQVLDVVSDLNYKLDRGLINGEHNLNMKVATYALQQEKQRSSDMGSIKDNMYTMKESFQNSMFQMDKHFTSNLNDYHVKNMQNYHKLDMQNMKTNERMSVLQESQNSFTEYLNGMVRELKTDNTYTKKQVSTAISNFDKLNSANQKTFQETSKYLDANSQTKFLQAQEKINSKIYEMKEKMVLNQQIENRIKREGKMPQGEREGLQLAINNKKLLIQNLSLRNGDLDLVRRHKNELKQLEYNLDRGVN